MKPTPETCRHVRFPVCMCALERGLSMTIDQYIDFLLSNSLQTHSIAGKYLDFYVQLFVYVAGQSGQIPWEKRLLTHSSVILTAETVTVPHSV